MNTSKNSLERYQPVLDLMGTLTPEQSQLALAIYQGIADQGLVTLNTLSSLTNKSVAEIDTYLNEIPGVFRDNQRNIIGFWGLTAAPVSHHQLIFDNKTLYAWCAWDTLFLPELLNVEATVKSKCAQSEKHIELIISPQEILSTSAPDIQVSMLVPAEDEFNADILGSFCHHIFFFENSAAGEEWITDKENMELMSLEEAFRLGARKNHNQFHF